MKIQRVVLIGAQAQGKSTFFNKITNQIQKTFYAGYSCTGQIVQETTAYEQGFEVIDIPGYNSSQDKLLHIADIIAALKYGIINRILIVTKYERNDLIINNLELVFRPIHRYRSKVTVIFTHWDMCEKDNEQLEQQRIKELIGKKFELDSFLCFSQYDEPKYICQAIEKILLSQHQEESTKLYESEIQKNFDIMELDFDNNDKLSDHVTYIQREFRKIANSYIQFIKSLQATNPHFQLILHEITLKIIRRIINSIIKKKQTLKQIVDVQGNNLQNLHYICLKKEIRMDEEKVIQIALQKMKESKFHFFNFLIRCPNCKEIWLEAIGCDGATCGKGMWVNQVSDGFLFVQPKKKIQLLRNDKNELQCIVNQKIHQNPRQEYLEQVFNVIQENKLLKQKVQDSNKLGEINTLKKIIDQLIKGDISESSLIQKIESTLQLIEIEKNKQNEKASGMNSSEQNVSQKSTQPFQQIQFRNFQISPSLQSPQLGFKSNLQTNIQFKEKYPPTQNNQKSTQSIHQPQVPTLKIRPQIQNIFRQQHEFNLFSQFFQPSPFQKQGLGCGQPLYWSKLEPLSQEELDQL